MHLRIVEKRPDLLILHLPSNKLSSRKVLSGSTRYSAIFSLAFMILVVVSTGITQSVPVLIISWIFFWGICFVPFYLFRLWGNANRNHDTYFIFDKANGIYQKKIRFLDQRGKVKHQHALAEIQRALISGIQSYTDYLSIEIAKNGNNKYPELYAGNEENMKEEAQVINDFLGISST